MRIGILTGGGDVPGLNPCIKAVVNRVAEQGHEVVGFKRGWGGLLNCNPDDAASIASNTIELDPHVVRTVDRTGGTFLHTSRTHPGRVRDSEVPEFLLDNVEGEGPHDLTAHALRVLETLDGGEPVELARLDPGVTAPTEAQPPSMIFGGVVIDTDGFVYVTDASKRTLLKIERP